jgi:3-hydroxybutyryl-CoA dehydratase
MTNDAHPECRELAYADIAVGTTASFSTKITPELVAEFARWSGDQNPLHVDQSYAEHTPLKKPIAHGMIVGGLFSRLIGMQLPGKYSLYLSQTLRFHEPTAIGTELIIRGEITGKTDAYQTVTVRLTAEDAVSKKMLVSGEAMVKLLR